VASEAEQMLISDKPKPVDVLFDEGEDSEVEELLIEDDQYKMVVDDNESLKSSVAGNNEMNQSKQQHFSGMVADDSMFIGIGSNSSIHRQT
jgi:hypothetical protein